MKKQQQMLIAGVTCLLLLSGILTVCYPVEAIVTTPEISIEKTVDFDGDGIYTDLEANYSGEAAHWKIVVTNIGDSPVYDIMVTDTNGETFGPFDLLEPGDSETFYYYTNPEEDFVNTACAEGIDDLGDTVGPVCDPAEVIILVDQQGCTLTIGYWKTHSEYGPASYDDTWGLLPDGADTMFLGTGKTYYQILHMSPRGGNAYLILAHQYIAAELNGLREDNPELPGDILDTMADAESLLIDYEGTMSIPKGGQDRADAIYLAGILDDFNNGLYPNWPHCD